MHHLEFQYHLLLVAVVIVLLIDETILNSLSYYVMAWILYHYSTVFYLIWCIQMDEFLRLCSLHILLCSPHMHTASNTFKHYHNYSLPLTHTIYHSFSHTHTHTLTHIHTGIHNSVQWKRPHPCGFHTAASRLVRQIQVRTCVRAHFIIWIRHFADS